MKNWEVVQVNLAQKGVLIDSPEGLFNWIEQIQLEGSSWQKLAESLVVQQQQLMSLLGAIVQDTEAAATSIMQELVMVDASVERLDHHLNGLEAQVDQLGSVSPSQLSSQLDAVFQHVLTVFLNHQTDISASVAKCADKLSCGADDIKNKLLGIIGLLSFKVILEASVAEESGKSFAQIAGEVRNLARLGLMRADESHLLIEVLQSAVAQQFVQIGNSFDLDREQLVALQNEIEHLLKNHTELTAFFAALTQQLRDVNRDVSTKTRMVYAQTQFQDIVRQKAERGIALIQSTIATLKLLSTDADMKVMLNQLQAAIVAYKQVEALHVSFHHSGADISHHGGNMTIDLF